MYNVNDLNLDTLVGIDLDALSAPGEGRVKAPTFVEDGILYLNCETNIFIGDYYNEFGMEHSIIKEVRDWAKENGGFWEWVNPGLLMFCKDDC